MSVLGVLLLAGSLSMDALGIGISYGVRGIRTPVAAKVIICAISMAVLGVSILVGSVLAMVLPPLAAKLLGASMLGLLGVFVILQAFWKKEPKPKKRKKETVRSIMLKSLGITVKIIRNPPSCDFDSSKTLDGFEAVYLGMALSVDSIGVGFGSAVMGLNTMLVPVSAGVFQMLFLSAGTLLGGKLARCARVEPKIWTVISGLLLIGIAVIRYFAG